MNKGARTKSPVKQLHFRETWRLLYPVRVLLFGLIIAQGISMVLVGFSNYRLHLKLLAIQATGCGPLPGANLDPALTSWKAAVCGGLFFTLSIGAGIVLLSLAATLLVEALGGRTRKTLIGLLLLVWLTILFWANANGPNYALTSFLVLLPPPVIWVCLSWSPRRAGENALFRRRAIHFLLIAALVTLYLSRLNLDIFVTIKDNLLLTNRPGIKAVHFYYQYTLYAAEAFKSLAQKQVKTCTLIHFKDRSRKQKTVEKMATYGYFPIPPEAGAPLDLCLRKNDSTLTFFHNEQTILQVALSAWNSRPGDFLQKYSDRLDTARAFRKITFYLLLGVAPLVLYLTAFTGFAIFPGLLLNLRLSSLVVPMLSCLLWVPVLFVLGITPVDLMNRPAAARAIVSGDRGEQLAALRYIFHNRLDIRGFEGYSQLTQTKDLALRYWLLNNYGNSDHPETARQVVAALDAEAAYLVCRAIAALGRKTEPLGTATVQQLLLKKLTKSPNWYVQLSAYQSLRETGWKPRQSNCLY